MSIELPKTHYSLLEAFNLIGKEEYGETWTGEEAVAAEEKLSSTAVYAPEELRDAAERYNKTLEKFRQLMALGIPAEQLFNFGWRPLAAHRWEVPGCWISIMQGQIDVEDGGYDGRKVRIERAPFDRVVSGEPLDDARGEDKPEVDADRLSEPSPQEVLEVQPSDAGQAAAEVVEPANHAPSKEDAQYVERNSQLQSLATKLRKKHRGWTKTDIAEQIAQEHDFQKLKGEGALSADAIEREIRVPRRKKGFDRRTP